MIEPLFDSDNFNALRLASWQQTTFVNWREELAREMKRARWISSPHERAVAALKTMAAALGIAEIEHIANDLIRDYERDAKEAERAAYYGGWKDRGEDEW